MFGLLSVLALIYGMYEESPTCFTMQKLLLREWNYRVTSGSNTPTLAPGNCIVVRTTPTVLRAITPGQMIVFNHAVRNEVFFDRVVATGGQVVQMIDGVLVIDGVPVLTRPMGNYIMPSEPNLYGNYPLCGNHPQPGNDCITPMLREFLPNGASYLIFGCPTTEYVGKYG